MAVRVSCQGLIYSLFEVEEFLSHHPAVLKLLAFTAVHIELGDVLGVAIVAAVPVTLGELRAFGSGLLPTSLLPTVLVRVDALSGMPSEISGTGTLRDELPALLKLPAPLGPGFAGSSAACHWEACAATGGRGDVRSVLRLLWPESVASGAKFGG